VSVLFEPGKAFWMAIKFALLHDFHHIDGFKGLQFTESSLFGLVSFVL